MTAPSITAEATSEHIAPRTSSIQSPARRAWRRFRSNRLGYVSLIVFAVLFGISLLAEVLSNDKPLVVKYNGHWYFPLAQTLPETTFGGDFPTPTDYLDP
jgi:microcin C transport system permease protein